MSVATEMATVCVSCGAPDDLNLLDTDYVRGLRAERARTRALLEERMQAAGRLSRRQTELEHATRLGDEPAAVRCRRSIESLEARLPEIDRQLEGRGDPDALTGTVCATCGAPLANGALDVSALVARRKQEADRARRLVDLQDDLHAAQAGHRARSKEAELALARGERAIAVGHEERAQNAARRAGDVERAIVALRGEMTAGARTPAARAERRRR